MPTRSILPHPAAVLPGEAEMLAAVAAHLSDHTRKMVYADWLEERGDPRGPALRAFVQALENGGQLPGHEALPAGWCETVGLRLAGRIREFGLEPYRDRLLALARPVLELHRVRPARKAAAQPGGSQLGGRPALPRGTPWPGSALGPFTFFAQFDLADLHRAAAGFRLPPAGLLSFFGHQGSGEGDPGHTLVLHIPPGEDIEAAEPPGDLEGGPGLPFTFTLRESLDLPYNISSRELPLSAGKPYHELLRAQRDVNHVLFGYARPQHVGSDLIPGPEWEQLISFMSDDDLGWNWGDAHEFFWYIRTADLEAGRFDRTVAYDG